MVLSRFLEFFFPRAEVTADLDGEKGEPAVAPAAAVSERRGSISSVASSDILTPGDLKELFHPVRINGFELRKYVVDEGNGRTPSGTAHVTVAITASRNHDLSLPFYCEENLIVRLDEDTQNPLVVVLGVQTMKMGEMAIFCVSNGVLGFGAQRKYGLAEDDEIFVQVTVNDVADPARAREYLLMDDTERTERFPDVEQRVEIANDLMRLADADDVETYNGEVYVEEVLGICRLVRKILYEKQGVSGREYREFQAGQVGLFSHLSKHLVLTERWENVLEFCSQFLSWRPTEKDQDYYQNIYLHVVKAAEMMGDFAKAASYANKAHINFGQREPVFAEEYTRLHELNVRKKKEAAALEEAKRKAGAIKFSAKEPLERSDYLPTILKPKEAAPAPIPRMGTFFQRNCHRVQEEIDRTSDVTEGN